MRCTKFNIKFLHADYEYFAFMCFVWISEQTVTFALHSTEELVFITETECVYCAVGTGYLYIIQVSFSGL